jgi:hypothetical protein
MQLLHPMSLNYRRVAGPASRSPPCRLCIGWLLAMAEMKVLLAVMFRGHTLQLQEPDEPWMLFPLARPKHGMPARFTAVAVPAAAAVAAAAAGASKEE